MPEHQARFAYFAVKNFSTRFGNGRILAQIMEAIGITLVCVAALVVPALLLSRRQRNGLRRHRRDADGGFWFPGGNDSSAEQPHLRADENRAEGSTLLPTAPLRYATDGLPFDISCTCLQSFGSE